MNAAVKIASRARPFTQAQTVPLKHNGITLLLVVMALVSALAVVYIKDLSRRLFIEYQVSEDTQHQLTVDWGKLLLEQSAWSTEARVQTIAEQRLGMEVPTPNNVVIVRE